jgi:hypothetical protein
LRKTVVQETEPITATAIETTHHALILVLADRRVQIPWERCSKELAAATELQRSTVELSPGGYGIHWPLLDEDLSIPCLVRDAGSADRRFCGPRLFGRDHVQVVV